MGAGSWFATPTPVRRSFTSRVPPELLAARLSGAAATRRSSSSVDGSPYVVVLEGTVDGRAVALRGRLERADGGQSRTEARLIANGSIEATPTGSTLDVVIGASVRREAVVLTLLATAILGFALTRGFGWATVVLIGSVIGTGWAFVLRAAQRFSLRYVGQFEGLLEALAAGG
jgi:hypothetical protein